MGKKTMDLKHLEKDVTNEQSLSEMGRKRSSEGT